MLEPAGVGSGESMSESIGALGSVAKVIADGVGVGRPSIVDNGGVPGKWAIPSSTSVLFSPIERVVSFQP